MTHQMLIGSKTRGCIVMLIDQSSSMSLPFGGYEAETREIETARALNACLQELALTCRAGQEIKDRCDIGVIGYGSRVGSALSGGLTGRDLVSIVEIAHNPVREDLVNRRVPDGAGGIIEVPYPMPIWVDPTNGGSTPMAEAFDLARSWVSTWAAQNSASFPPVIINITDGEPNDMDDTRIAAQRLHAVSTNDGGTLVFNLHISGTTGAALVTPADASGLPDQYARFLFDISSPIPPSLMGAAANEGLSSGAGARGFIYNANVDHMIRLLKFGTAGTVGRGVQEHPH